MSDSYPKSVRLWHVDGVGSACIDSFHCWSRWDPTMRIDDQFLNNVCFIGQPRNIVLDGATAEEINQDMHWGGTGFFVLVMSECGRGGFHYLVTARHVVEGFERGKDVFFRSDREGEGLNLVNLYHNREAWIFHPNKPQDIDVAVIGLDLPFDVFAIKALNPAVHFLSRNIIKTENVGIGDNVFAVGLFSKMPGSDKNFPLVRTGFIAMMPDEPIPNVKIGNRKVNADAYIIESRSIGGWSGSPVFVRQTLRYQFVTPKGNAEIYATSPEPYLLGLVNGHWEIPGGTENHDHLKNPDRYDERKNWNVGLTVIVPAEKIYEVLFQPRLVEDRKKAVEQAYRDSGTVPDSEPPAQ